MNLSDLDPTTISQLKFQLAGDLTATVAVVLTDGRLEVFQEVSLAAARELQAKVSANPPQLSTEIVPRETIEKDPHENEPGPPISQQPCMTCGTVHPAEGNPTCRCVFCFQIKEIVHSGACADCMATRWGGIYELMGIPITTASPEKPPWLK